MGLDENPVPSTLPYTLHAVFERNVLDQPDAPAVCAWDGDLSYQELDRKSSALARILFRRGVRSGALVALCFDPSRWTAVAMMAVSKAGGVWFFLEPKHPVNRLQQMCHTVEARIVLCSRSQASVAHELSGEQMMAPLIIEEPVLQEDPGAMDLELVSPSRPAYVAFTSGSTGKPKGALMTHQAAVAGVLHNAKPMQLARTSRVLQFASFAFDISFLEHFWALLLGGCLCIPSPQDRQNNLAHAVQVLQVNWTFLTPTVARLLEPPQLSSLQTLVLGGEAVTQADLDMWLPYVHLSGLYGPAECAVGLAVQPDYSRVESAANIGFPFSVACWVVNEEDSTQLVPRGTVGELVVEGPSISEGYINAPEQTARAYLTNPTWMPAARHSTKKLYRTGDLVRYLDDGSLLFLGRKDTQVKINGQRIELGEIEYHTRAVLSRDHLRPPPVVAEAMAVNGRPLAVIAFYQVESSCQDPDHVQEDIFLPPDQGFVGRKTSYQSQLRDHLPEYMIPTSFIPVLRMPSTMSGKTDRKTLREKFAQLSRDRVKAYFVDGNGGSSSSGSGMIERMPTTSLERRMQRLWAATLKLDLEEVGRNDPWMSLGGESLAAMRLVAQARKEGITVTVPDIFRHKTIATLCQHVSVRLDAEIIESIPPFSLLPCHGGSPRVDELRKSAAQQCELTPEEIEDLYPFTAMQEAVVIPPATLGVNYTLHLDVKLPSELDLERLMRAWDTVVAANSILRMRVVRLPADEKETMVLAQTRPKVSMEPLFPDRFAPGVDLWGLGRPLVRVGVAPGRLVMLIQHALYDGHSLGLIFRDLEQAYRGQPVPAVSFSSFVRWSTEWQDGSLKQQYWREKFVGFDGRVCPPRVADSEVSCIESRHLWGSLNFKLDDFTVTSKIRVALAVVLSWHFGLCDLVLGGIYARRGAPIPGIMEAAVPTSAILPDRIRLDPTQSLRANIDQDHENILTMMPYEGTRPSQIRDLSEATRAASQFQAILAVQQDNSSLYPEIFRNHEMGYYGPVTAHNLMMQCFLNPQRSSARVSLRLSEPTMQQTTDWDRFLGHFEAVVDAIHRDPEISLNMLRQQLGA
ncbi:putative nonribosomal peptide synthase [Aspergillus saccharolyticus JOP 1030-1]|uniref:Putative nonribosomal peptide synthase n=1 Tax=Aspergillus saccharolyticus JOP 1030-1 TaxID=1450539 RepID=A0A318ZBM8_9EURO|nr:putative nonribosomal peptide synthase [Aspergillus saccharolyticus JOP 1030-1]PYH43734.1 putative nonribosomal peptide synthase [Aspergillus saccharolyticus JOP 1030-1]